MEHKELVKFMSSVFYPFNLQADAGSFLVAIMPAMVKRMACIFWKLPTIIGILNVLC